MTMVLQIPPHYGLTPAPTAGYSLHDRLLVWEAPRSRGPRQYILSADIGDGLGQDYSSADLIRLPTLEEPAEQVAQFVTNRLSPSTFASVLDAMGHLYVDGDGRVALAAIEVNNHGLSTQDTLRLHLGYPRFYRWEVADAADPKKRWTQRIGWVTTSKTRPILLDMFYQAVSTRDPITGLPDLILNSPLTLAELPDFQTQGALYEAEASRGAHDDCLMSAAIGYYIAWRRAAGEREPVAERRRRRVREQAEAERAGRPPGDDRCQDLTVDEIRYGPAPVEAGESGWRLGRAEW